MPLKRLYERLLLRPADMKPTRDDFEVVGVFNPGAVRIDGEVILLVRVAERPREKRPGLHRPAPLDEPRRAGGGLGADDELEPVDPRVVRRKADGLVRLTFTSHLRVVRCGDGRSVQEITERPLRSRPRSWRSTASRTRGSRRSTAGSTSLTSRSRATARRRPWPRRPTSASSPAREPSSAARTRTWSSSPSGSPGPTWPCTAPTRRPVLPPRDVGRLVPGHHPLGPSRRSPRRRRRVGDRPRRRGTPPVRVPGGWLEIYHGSRHTTTPGRGRQVLHGRPAPGPRRTPRRSSAAPRNRSSSPPPSSSATASCPTSSSRPASSRPRTPSSSTTVPPIPARPSSSSHARS